MLRTTLLVLCLVCLCHSAFPQPNINFDSLRREVNKGPKLITSYLDSIETTLSNTNPMLPALYVTRGLAYRKQGIIADALKNYNEALRYARQLNDKPSEADALMELATMNEMSSEYVKAIELNQQALDLYIELKDTANIVTVYNNMGIINMEKHDHAGAIRYYRKAIDLNNKIGDKLSNARMINNIGLVYQKKMMLDSALDYFNTALTALDIEKQKYGYALVTNNIGICYRDLKQYDKALEQFETAKKLQTELNDQYGLGLANFNIGRSYYHKGDYRKSIKAFNEAAGYAATTSNLNLLEDISDWTARTYEANGDFRNAYKYQKQAKTYADSVQAKSLSNEIADLEVKYQVKQQQNEIELLKSQNELHLATSRNKDLVLLTSAVFSVLILTLLIVLWRSLRIKQKANAIIREKNEKLEHLNHEKNSLMGIVAHDLVSPLNSIAGITNILPSVGPLNEPQKEFVAVITNVVNSSRALVKDLMDLSALENNELKVHLEPVSITEVISDCKTKYTAEAISKGISVVIVDDEPIAPVYTDKSHVDRVLQNLLSNALKFSNPGSTVRMGASRNEDVVTFFVSDEGPGITEKDQKLMFRKFMKLTARPTNGESSTGLGLSIVKALIEDLGGKIVVDSTVGKGTTFMCEIPAGPVPVFHQPVTT